MRYNLLTCLYCNTSMGEVEYTSVEYICGCNYSVHIIIHTMTVNNIWCSKIANENITLTHAMIFLVIKSINLKRKCMDSYFCEQIGQESQNIPFSACQTFIVIIGHLPHK